MGSNRARRIPGLGYRWLLAVLVICTLGAVSAQSVLRVAASAAPPTLGPSFTTGYPDITAIALMFDPLIQFGPNMELEGRLATSWTMIAPTTWEFTLREGVTFHNGEAFTADDVVANIEWALDPANQAAYRAYLGAIISTEVVDDYTIRLHTAEPYPMLPYQFLDRYIFAGDYLAEVGPDNFGRAPVGTGAFVFGEYVTGQKLTVTAYDAYWDGRPTVDVVELYPIPEPATRVSALFSGSVDLITHPPVEQLNNLRQRAGVQVVEYPTVAVLTLVMNTHEPPLDDVRVRQAIHHAVNRQEIIDALLDGVGAEINGQLVPGVPGANPDLQPYEYNPQRSRELLAEAGYPNGFSLTIHAPVGRYLQDIQIAEAVAGYLSAVGIAATAQPIDWAILLGALGGNPLLDGIYMIGNGQSTLDAATFYQGYVLSGFRGVYYSRPDVDELGERATAELDADLRADIYRQMEEIVWADAFWLPITQRFELLAMSDSVTFTPRQLEYFYLREASLNR